VCFISGAFSSAKGGDCASHTSYASCAVENSTSDLLLYESKVKVKVILRSTVSRPVYLGVRHPSGTRDQFFLSLFCIDNSGFPNVGRPLWREDGSIIYLYNCFWALPEQSFSGPCPSELMVIFYCLIWDSRNLKGQVPVFISTRNRVAQIYPPALGSLFISSYLAGLQWKYYNPPPHGDSWVPFFWLPYKNSVLSSQETYKVCVTMTNRLTLFKEKCLFLQWSSRNTHIQYVGVMQIFSVLKHVIHIVTTTGSDGLICQFITLNHDLF
jgi:hypothetical protein